MPGDDATARDRAWYRECATPEVPLDSSEAVLAITPLRQSIPTARVIRLERVQHRGLWANYVAGRGMIARENGDANEQLLFHGTGPIAPASILAHPHGLDPRKSASGGFYGRGVYLAVNPAYTVGGRYAHRIAGSGGMRMQVL